MHLEQDSVLALCMGRKKSHPGFHSLGHIFNKYGCKTFFLDEAPTAANLKNASVYIIVDPDQPKENQTPNYVAAKTY